MPSKAASTRLLLKELYQPSIKRRPLSILLPSKPRERGTPWRCQETRTGYQSGFENCYTFLVTRESLLSLGRSGINLDLRLGLGVNLLGGRLAVGSVVLAGALVGGARLVILVVSALIIAITTAVATAAVLGLAGFPVIRVASVAAVTSTAATATATTTSTSAIS